MCVCFTEILRNASLHVVNFDVLMNEDLENSDLMNVIELMNTGIRNGAVIPLDREIYAQDKLADAFK